MDIVTILAVIAGSWLSVGSIILAWYWPIVVGKDLTNPKKRTNALLLAALVTVCWPIAWGILIVLKGVLKLTGDPSAAK